jgi:ethanolamine utilization protein EutP (predicted NTPase)
MIDNEVYRLNKLLEERGLGNIINVSLKDDKEVQELRDLLKIFKKDISKIKGEFGD